MFGIFSHPKPKDQAVEIKDGHATVYQNPLNTPIIRFEYRDHPRNVASKALELSILHNRDLAAANFKNSLFQGNNFSKLRLNKADFEGSFFDISKYEDGEFKGANFKNCAFSVSFFMNCDMREADFSNIELSEEVDTSTLNYALTFKECDMEGAVFSVDTNWPECEFENCTNLDKAVIVDKEGNILPKATLTKDGVTYSSKHNSPTAQAALSKDRSAISQKNRKAFHAKIRGQK